MLYLFLDLTLEKVQVHRWRAGSGVTARSGDGDPPPAMLMQPTILVWPSEQLMLTQAAIPVMAGSKFDKALPFSVEEKIANRVDENVVKVLHRQGSTTDVAVLNRALTVAATNLINRLRLKKVRTLPDVLLLPYQAEQWTVWLGETVTLVRTGPYAGFAAAPLPLGALTFPMLTLALARAEPAPKKLLVLSSSAEKLDALTLHDITVERHLSQDTDPFVAAIDESIDLLERNPWALRWQRWQPLLWPTAKAAIFVLGIWAAMLAIDVFSMSRESRRLQEGIDARFRSVFGDSATMVAPVAQLENKLGGQIGREEDPKEFWPQLAALGEAGRKLALPRPQTLRYTGNRLIAEFAAPPPSSLVEQFDRAYRANLSGKVLTIQSAK